MEDYEEKIGWQLEKWWATAAHQDGGLQHEAAIVDAEYIIPANTRRDEGNGRDGIGLVDSNERRFTDRAASWKRDCWAHNEVPSWTGGQDDGPSQAEDAAAAVEEKYQITRTWRMRI